MFSTVCRSACHTTSLGLRSSPFRKLPSSLSQLFHQRSLASFIPVQECLRRALQVNQEQKYEKARGEAMRSSLKHMHADKVRKAGEKIKKLLERTAQNGFPEPKSINEMPKILCEEDIVGVNFLEPEAEQLIADLKAAGYKVEIQYNEHWAHHALHKYANKFTVSLIQKDDNKYSIIIEFSYSPDMMDLIGICNRYLIKQGSGLIFGH